jgi:hypothetical protein
MSFNILPEDIIDLIYFKVHQLNFKKSLDQIPFSRNIDFDNYIYKKFFNSPMNNYEVREFDKFNTWMILKIEYELSELPIELMLSIENSKYVNMYIDFWNDTTNWDDDY